MPIGVNLPETHLHILLYSLSREVQVAHASSSVAETACPQMDIMNTGELIHLMGEMEGVCVVWCKWRGRWSVRWSVSSLVPRPETARRKGPGFHCLRMRAHALTSGLDVRLCLYTCDVKVDNVIRTVS